MTETIAPPTAKPINHWIGGKSVPSSSGRSGPVWNPATGEQSGAVDFATVEEIDAAVQVAKETFATWREVSLARRAELFFKIRQLIDEHRTGPVVRLQRFRLSAGSILRDGEELVEPLTKRVGQGQRVQFDGRLTVPSEVEEALCARL